jgi:hypothetical protein
MIMNKAILFASHSIPCAASAPPSNSKLSMPQSLSTFPNPYNQNNTFRIEDTEIYHNDSKDDVAD